MIFVEGVLLFFGLLLVVVVIAGAIVWMRASHGLRD